MLRSIALPHWRRTMASRVQWQGRQVTAQILRRAAEALTEIDLRIEAEAKQELYPGHGKITGTLQRGIQGSPGRVEGNTARGSVGVKGVKYAKRLHKKYRFILIGLERVRPEAKGILRKHVAKG
jgi:hypothetical protein